MRFHPLSSTLGLTLLCSPSYSADAWSQGGAFLPRGGTFTRSSSTLKSTASLIEVETSVIEGMRPGTSGLRKKVEVWQGIDEANKYYVENFIQSLIETAIEANDGKNIDTLIVAGDGRYFNTEAIQIICRVLAGNGVSNIWIPKGGIMSTPAVSAAIRSREGGKAEGGIVLTASHNPGGPGEDFGIKYNEGFGQPAGEGFTEALYAKSLELKTFKTVKDSEDFDLNAESGTTYSITDDTTVTIIDPFDTYLDSLQSCFDFDGLKKFCQRDGVSILFDGMHGAGGPFAKRVLVDELGLPEVSFIMHVCTLIFYVSITDHAYRKSIVTVLFDEM
jgi:phosphoglucomutase